MRRKTRQIIVGDVAIGSDAPISIQSMTNTDTADVAATVAQVKKLEAAGCQIVRMAVNSLEDAAALELIQPQIQIPIIADIQFDYRLAVAAAEHGAKGMRINPGNIGAPWKVQEVVRACAHHGISIRVGVNSGSIEQEILDRYHGVNVDSIVASALEETEELEAMGFSDIKVSLKSSDVRQSIESYRAFAKVTDYPLHLGITEAGPPKTGAIRSAVGIGTLLAEGIGDTLRISLTADPVEEIYVAKEILKSLDLYREGISIVSCPTCARTKINLIELVEEAQRRFEGMDYQGKIAIMGCVVNGPGEAREADFGITGGDGKGILFKKGQVVATVPEEELLDTLIRAMEEEARGDGK
ncbi:MAG: flavodoxin-dependent (E)-4-hydroxy-3-methylbut-2-enyl-diphosphate synthase [Tissierellia bacterium]|nr:flavodoxin-dependent (E)-4-hydroxy-3-methylbut-2-enyl-diphosphate synthase [Tissierellia bacterium]